MDRLTLALEKKKKEVREAQEEAKRLRKELMDVKTTLNKGFDERQCLKQELAKSKEGQC